MNDGSGPNAIVACVVIFVVLVVMVALYPHLRYKAADPCEDCKLPRITPKMWDREEYRCRECGTRYRIVTDMWRPRDEYRRWVAINREELDDAPGGR